MPKFVAEISNLWHLEQMYTKLLNIDFVLFEFKDYHRMFHVFGYVQNNLQVQNNF